MAKIMECVPNFSEGRDPDVLEGLVRVARSFPGVTLADWSADTDHHRSVFTLLGAPEGIERAAFALAKYAKKRIDLTRHHGEHPRMGAADVIPFVPVRGVSMDECVAVSRRVAQRIGAELGVPVYLYGAAADETRRNLADIRRGGFEGFFEKMRLPGWTPDAGPDRPHPTAGVTAVGARGFLVAFNVNLNTPDIRTACRIARAVRASGGGLPGVKAIGVRLKSRGIAQVSMNITDYTVTPLLAAFERVRDEAAQHGTGIIGSEIVGLAPERALSDAGSLQLEQPDITVRTLEQLYPKE